MKTYSRLAGAVLRQLRYGRNMTLQQAVAFFSISVATLSRKERGLDPISRMDIRKAIHGYHLSPAESAELWAAAGLLPDPPVSRPMQVDMQSFAGPLLVNVLLPAFVVDALGYIKAWNQAIEFMWQFGSVSERPLHLISTVFTPRVRAMMGDEWPQAAARFVAGYYRDTLGSSGNPDYPRSIRMLEDRHGDEFVHMWNDARRQLAGSGNAGASDVGGVRVIYKNGEYEIEYLVMQSVFRFSMTYLLLIHVPFGPENHIRYEALSAAMGPQRVYFAE